VLRRLVKTSRPKKKLEEEKALAMSELLRASQEPAPRRALAGPVPAVPAAARFLESKGAHPGHRQELRPQRVTTLSSAKPIPQRML